MSIVFCARWFMDLLVVNSGGLFAQRLDLRYNQQSWCGCW